MRRKRSTPPKPISEKTRTEIERLRQEPEQADRKVQAPGQAAFRSSKVDGETVMAEPEQKLVELKVVWNEAKDMPVSFSNVFLIQHSHAEFYLTFGSVDPPFYGPPTPAELADVQKNGVSAKPIIKLAIPPQRMVELFQLIQGQLTQFQQGQKQ